MCVSVCFCGRGITYNVVYDNIIVYFTKGRMCNWEIMSRVVFNININIVISPISHFYYIHWY